MAKKLNTNKLISQKRYISRIVKIYFYRVVIFAWSVCMLISATICESQKRTLDPLKSEFQEVVSCPGEWQGLISDPL